MSLQGPAQRPPKTDISAVQGELPPEGAVRMRLSTQRARHSSNTHKYDRRLSGLKTAMAQTLRQKEEKRH